MWKRFKEFILPSNPFDKEITIWEGKDMMDRTGKVSSHPNEEYFEGLRLKQGIEDLDKEARRITLKTKKLEAEIRLMEVMEVYQEKLAKVKKQEEVRTHYLGKSLRPTPKDASKQDSEITNERLIALEYDVDKISKDVVGILNYIG